MKNKKLKIGLGVALVALVALVVGGCASIDRTTAKLAGAKEQVLYGIPLTFGRSSAEEICKKYPSDERCKNVEFYKGETVQVRETTWMTDDIPVLVPKGTDYPVRSVLRVRVKGNAPGYFEGVAAQSFSDPDCYRDGMFGKGSTGPGGVICPKYGYDYRNVKWGD